MSFCWDRSGRERLFSCRAFDNKEIFIVLLSVKFAILCHSREGGNPFLIYYMPIIEIGSRLRGNDRKLLKSLLFFSLSAPTTKTLQLVSPPESAKLIPLSPAEL